jgi:hypothetical protein
MNSYYHQSPYHQSLNPAYLAFQPSATPAADNGDYSRAQRESWFPGYQTGFGHIRNPFGFGSGTNPALSSTQTLLTKAPLASSNPHIRPVDIVEPLAATAMGSPAPISPTLGRGIKN